MTEKESENYYWSGIAARYHALTPPLRISTAEQQVYGQLAAQWDNGQRSPRVLVMGATPEFHHLPWPAGAQLLAVDRSQAMLSAVWPGTAAQSLCADWSSMRLPDESQDIVLCDGGLSFFSYPQALRNLLATLARIMAPGGLFIARLYVRGESVVTVDEILQRFARGQISNSNELKLRLWLALDSGNGQGVRLHDVWSVFDQACSSLRARQALPAWSEVDWLGMQAYRDLQDVYHFPSVELLAGLMAEADPGFSLEANITPEAACSEHLRIVSFRLNKQR